MKAVPCVQIFDACASLGDPADPTKPYQPAVTFIVVRKRHATRLYPAGGTRTDREGNLFAGAAPIPPMPYRLFHQAAAVDDAMFVTIALCVRAL